jgi:transcriptional regulator with XRE-family HTH domain
MGSKARPRTWLVELRGERTQKEMAEALDISRAFYSQLELGIRGVSFETARRIASRLGVPWTSFYTCGEENGGAVES